MLAYLTVMAVFANTKRHTSFSVVYPYCLPLLSTPIVLPYVFLKPLSYPIVLPCCLHLLSCYIGLIINILQ